MAVLRAAQEPVRILCTRELQKSIKDSVHYLIVSQIKALGLTGLFDTGEHYAKGLNGSEFVYKGLRYNSDEIKSTENIAICWMEEGHTTSKKSLQALIPTIRAPGSEIWITYNPDQDTDPVHELAENPPPGAIVRTVNWRDNPWFPAELDAERRHMARTDPDAYEHVWEGKTWHRSDAQVLNGKWVIDTFEPSADWDGPYYGIDWGFSVDPSVMIRCWLRPDGGLMIEYEAYGIKTELDDLPQLFDKIPHARKWPARADSSRPETISHVNAAGFNIIPAEKGQGSVEDGVAWLQSRPEIVIHERCRHAAEEARLWSYKTDRLTGDVLPVLKDGHEHCWDAIRYACEPIIKRRKLDLTGARSSGQSTAGSMGGMRSSESGWGTAGHNNNLSGAW